MFFQILLAIVFNYGFTKCPITLQQMPSSMSCLYGLTCFTYQNTQRMVYQNCNMKWYLARNSTTTGGQYTHQPLPSMSSINRKVNSIKMNHQFMIVDYGNYLLYYNFGSGMPNYFTLNCTILNIDVLNPNHSKLQAIVICQSQVARLLFGNLYMSIQDYYQINYSLSTLKCMSNSSICLIGTQNGQLLYYNYDINKVQFLLNLPQNISVTKIVYKANINKTKAYVSCTNGRIYELIIQKDRFTIERQCIKFVNENIHELTVSLDGNYLIVSDKRANLTQLSTNSGILLDNINLDIYMQNKSSLTLNSVFINQSTYVIFNPLNKLMLAASVTPQNILNQYYLICFSMKYYNLSLQECKACSSNCSACSPVNGSCSDCAEGYFNKQGQCLSCFYEVQGLTTYFKECFSVSQKMIMDSSSSVVNFLSYSVSSFSNFLNILGILFIFMKVINNWNIISLYLFLPLDNIPFFLYNMLMTIYTNFNGSVLSYFKIQIDFAFNVKNGFQNNDKYLFTSKTTDFMKQNGENIILFIYSIILILTLFRFINYIFSRYNYQIFQHNHYFAILDQFIGTFTTSLVPFFSIVKLKCSTPMDKFNSFCFYNLMGLAIIAPFLILIVTQEKPKARRKNKVANLDDIAAIELIQKQKFKRKVKLINYDTSRQSFLYAILSFSIAILAPYENPIPFFIFISIIHILSIANILYSKNIPVNNLIQKINGFLFHIGFILFYILDDRHVQFYLSLAIVFIIIFGTVHEIIVGIFIKIQLIWLIIQAKIEKDKKIKQFLQSEKNKNKNKNREHPKEIKMPITSPQLAQVKNKKSKNVSFDNKAHICHQKSFVFSKNKIVPIKNVNFGQKQFENQFQPNFGFKTDNKLNNIYEKPKIKIRKQRGESVDKK